MDCSSTSSEISFHGLPSKSKCPSIRKQIVLSSQLIALLFLRNSHLQRDIWWSLILVKFAGFYRSSHRRCSVKKVFIRKVFAKSTRKQLCQILYFDKVAGLSLWKRCSGTGFPVNLAKFLRKSFLQNTFGRLLMAFPCNFTKKEQCQQCLENLRWILFI